MPGRQFAGAVATITIPLAVAVQAVLTAGDATPAAATPGAAERGAAIDPGFVVRFDGDVDPGFIVEFEDQSNDTGFRVIGDGHEPAPPPSPTPVPATPPATTLGSP